MFVCPEFLSHRVYNGFWSSSWTSRQTLPLSTGSESEQTQEQQTQKKNMTCIGADIFYGIKIPSNLTDQQLATLLILLYKKLNGLEYKEIDVDAMLAESKGEEDEEVDQPTTTTSRTSAKRKLARKPKSAKKQRIEPIDYNLLHLANQTLGFSVGTSMGNTWNGEGFSAIV